MSSPSLPSIPRTVDPKVRQAIDSLRSYFKNVDASGGLITKSQLSSGRVQIPQTSIVDDSNPVSIGGPLPAPGNLHAFGGVGLVRLTWDWYYGSGVAYTELFRAEVDNLDIAASVRQVEGASCTDYPSTNPYGKAYYYWIRYVGTDGNPGPFNSVQGTVGRTADDPNYALALIEGLVTESQLAQELTSRIDLIDRNFVFDDGFDEEIFSGLVDTYQSLFLNTSDLKSLTNQALSKLATIESEIAGLITTEWDQNSGWNEGQYVIYSGNVYVCEQTHSAPSPVPGTDDSYWKLSDSLGQILSEVEHRVDTLEGQIVTRVSTTTFNLLKNRVTDAEASIVTNSEGLSLKASKTELDAAKAIMAPDFDVNSTYQAGKYVRYQDTLYRCLNDITTTPARLPTNTSYWVACSDISDEVRTAYSEILVNADGIGLTSKSITGPLTTEEDVADGIFIEGIEDVENVDIRLTEARINIDSANRRIDLAILDINTALGQIATAKHSIEALTGALGAESVARTKLTVQVDENKSAIEREEKARADAVSAEAKARETLAVKVEANQAAIVSEEKARADAVSAETEARETLAVKVEANQAAIVSEEKARADAVSAETEARETLAVKVEANQAAIEREEKARADAVSAETEARERLAAKVESNLADIEREAKARADADSAETEAREILVAKVESNLAAIEGEVKARADADSAETEARETLAVKVGANQAAIEREEKARADAVSAETKAREILESAINENISAIEQSMSSSANDIGNLKGQFTVKVDLNGFVTGFGMASEVVDGIPFSEFMINANRFAIIDPNGVVVTISSLTQNAGLATAVTEGEHGFSTEDTVAIAGAKEGQYNGQKKITVVDSVTFTFPVQDDPVSPAVPVEGRQIKVMKTVVPFVVQGGQTYINSAIIGNAVIGAAQLKEAIINSSHIDILDASTIKTGTLEGVSVKTVDQATGNYSVLQGGDLVFYRGGIAYKYLKQIETGSAQSNTLVTLPYMDRAPKVMVSIRDLRAFDTDYANQNQRWAAKLDEDGIIDNKNGTYSFRPICQLTLDSGSAEEVLSYRYSGASTYSSSTKTSPASTNKITVSGSLNSSRGTGASNTYYYRQATVRLYYRLSPSGTWTYVSKTIAHGGDLTTDSFSITTGAITASTYDYYIYVSWADAGGIFTTGSTEYEYKTETLENLSTGGLARVGNSSGTYDEETLSFGNYSAPTGWDIYSVAYSAEVAYQCDIYYTYSRATVEFSSPAFSRTVNVFGSSTIPGSTSEGDISAYIKKSWSSSDFSKNITYSISYSNSQSGLAQMRIRNITAEIKLRKQKTNSTTASNSADIDSASFDLASAKIIDGTGVVNWLAIS